MYCAGSVSPRDGGSGGDQVAWPGSLAHLCSGARHHDNVGSARAVAAERQGQPLQGVQRHSLGAHCQPLEKFYQQQKWTPSGSSH